MRDAHTGIRGYRSRCASYCQCAVIVCVFLIYFVFFAVVPVAAQQAPNDSAQEQEEQSEEDELGEGIDAILLMDGSASMRLTDPKRLRDQGARLFTEFLRQGDRLAILEFSADVKAIRPLTPYVPELSYQVQQQIARVGDSGQYTDLLAGIKAA